MQTVRNLFCEYASRDTDNLDIVVKFLLKNDETRLVFIPQHLALNLAHKADKAEEKYRYEEQPVGALIEDTWAAVSISEAELAFVGRNERIVELSLEAARRSIILTLRTDAAEQVILDLPAHCAARLRRYLSSMLFEDDTASEEADLGEAAGEGSRH